MSSSSGPSGSSSRWRVSVGRRGSPSLPGSCSPSSLRWTPPAISCSGTRVNCWEPPPARCPSDAPGRPTRRPAATAGLRAGLRSGYSGRMARAAQWTSDSMLGFPAQAGDDLGVDVRFTVTTGYPRSPVRVEALEAWGVGEGQRKFILALVGQAQAVARIQAATAEGQRHVAVLIQGLFTRILHLSRKCNLCKCPLRPQGEGEVEADTVPGRAAAKGWAPLHGLGITQVRCGAFFHEECLRATFRRACREGADIKCPCIMPASALFPECKCNENLSPHRFRGS